MRDDELYGLREKRIQQGEKAFPPSLVEAVRRLVGDQEPCLGAGGQSDGHALCHAAGELERVFIQKRFRRVKARKAELFHGKRSELCALYTETAQAVAELTADRPGRVERFGAALRNVDELCPAQTRKGFRAAKRLTVETDASALHPDVFRQQAENGQRQHGLAGAGLADQGHLRAGGQGKADIPQKRPFTVRQPRGNDAAFVGKRRTVFSI